jgi:hypothetical protein
MAAASSSSLRGAAVVVSAGAMPVAVVVGASVAVPLVVAIGVTEVVVKLIVTFVAFGERVDGISVVSAVVVNASIGPVVGGVPPALTALAITGMSKPSDRSLLAVLLNSLPSTNAAVI